jgi:biopolymer transport protein ExbD
MKSKSARLVRRNHARYHSGRDDLNIVPMIDMMVILVFFLIFTAVFSKTNILQLNLPASNTSAPVDLPKGLKLEVIIRAEDLVVNDRNSGPLKVLANTATVPDMTDATVLPSPATSYDTLVQVMDTVRVYQLPVAPFSKAELFPDIAIADAPQ